MTKFDINRKNLYDDLLSLGYFKDDDGTINFPFEDFNSSLSDPEVARTLYGNLIADGFYQDEQGAATISEDEFVENLCDTRQKLDYYPITENQRGLYIDWEMNRDTTQYNIPSVNRLDGVDVESLRSALIAVVNAHPYLKTRLAERDGDIVQLRLDDEEVVVDTYTLTEKPDSRFFQQRVRPFDLFNDRLYRFEIYTWGDAVYLFQDIHHIIFDGGSSIVFSQDVLTLLQGEDILEETYSAFDRAQEEYEMEHSDAYGAAETYFDTLMSEYEVASYPHSAHPDTDEASAQVARVNVDGPSIKEFCRKNGFTENSFFMSALSEVLQRILREKHLYFTSITSGRVTTDMQNIMGMFVKTLPVVTCAGMDDSTKEGEMSVKAHISAMQQQYVNTQDNSIFPYTKLVEKTGARSEILFVYQGGISDAALEVSGDEVELESCDDDLHLSLDTVKVPISIIIQPEGTGYRIEIEYDGSLYSRKDMLLLLSMIRSYALTASKNGDKAVSAIPLVDEEEQEQLVRLSTGEELVYDTHETFIDLFRQQATDQPDALAVTDMSSSLTYGELDEQSDILASWLVSKGVKANDFVAIKTRRVKEFIVAVLGIQKASAAYVPVDPDYPQDRIDYMVEDSCAQIVLTEATISEALSTGNKPSITLKPTPDTLAYMIYTSGSTGKPKGVMISHRALRACIAWNCKEFDLRPGKKNVHHPSFSFDASTFDLFYPLAAGAEIHIFDEAIRKDMDGMARYIKDNGITGMTMSTALGMTLLNQFDLPIEYIMLGGEKFMPVKKSTARLYNGYGPTEFTVCSSFHIIDQDNDIDIPIGRPVPNSLSVICDKYGNLLPQGVAGELCLIGTQIADGYWHREALTSERFSAATFLGDGRKMYHTGDLATWNDEDELLFMGRIDTQVKLRGFRIEMGEVENAVSLYDGIDSVAAEVKTTSNGVQHLCLYFTADREIATDALRDFMAQSLTEYMVPTAFMQMDAMPMTPGGKINRKALPMPEIKSDTEYVEPATEAERTVAACFAKVLNCEGKMGALDNFFSWGGDSIKAIRLVSMLRQEGINLQVAQVMKLKTVRAIASEVSGTSQAIKVSQERWSGAIEPNSAIIQYFFNLQMPEPHHFNQANMYKVDERLDTGKLHQILDALVEHHDILRATVTGDSLTVGEELHATDFMEEHDLSTQTGAQLEAAFEEIGTKAQSTINLAGGPLLKALVLRTSEGTYLNLIIHHLVVDGVSWRIISEDLNTAATQLLGGKEISLPEKTHSYRDYAQALERYAQTYTLKREKPYWEEVRKKLGWYDTSVARNYDRKFGTVRGMLDKESTSILLTRCNGAYNTEINDLLLAALGRAYRRVSGKIGMTIQLEGHGRENFDDQLLIDRTVGWFTSAYPIVLEHLGGDLRQSIRETKETLRRIPNKGFGYSQLFGIDTERVPLFAFNYLGEFSEGGNSLQLPLQPSTDKPKGTSISARNTFGPDYSLNGAVSDGQLGFVLMYNEAQMDEDSARELIDTFFGELREIIRHTSGKDLSEQTASDLGETEWTDEEFQKVVKRFGDAGTTLQRIYPLTPMQEGMLLMHLSNPTSWAYRLVSIYELNVVPSEDQLRRVLDRLGKKYEVLRTAFIHDNVSVYRQAITDRPIGLEMTDLRGEPHPEEVIQKLREEKLTNGFDLQMKPLMQVTCARKTDDSSYLMISIHHIIVDGWCIQLYMSDLGKYLEQEISGTAMTDDYADTTGKYEAAVREIVGKDQNAALEYWRNLLDGYETRAEIPAWGEVQDAERLLIDSLETHIDKEATARLTEICKESHATMSNMVELLWAMILQEYSRTDDVVFAKVVSGRDNTRIDVNDVVGLFINSIPVRVRTGKESTAREILEQLQRQAAESNSYDFCPLSSIQQQSVLGNQLFQSVLAFENYGNGDAEESNEAASQRLQIKVVTLREENYENFSPTTFIDSDGRLTFKISFDTKTYHANDVLHILDMINTLAQSISNHPDKPLSGFERMSDEERDRVVAISQGERMDYDASATFPSLFMQQAASRGDATAVADEQGTYTYTQLNLLTGALAQALIDLGVQPNHFVSIMLGYQKEFLVAAIAVEKSGGAYVPLDYDYPNDRLLYMLEDSESQVLITSHAIYDEKNAEGEFTAKNILFIDDFLRDAKPTASDAELNRAEPDNLAYMIYTSGSTGKPKGVMIPHRAKAHFVTFIAREWRHTENSRICCHSSFSFDASIEDLYPVLTVGGTLYVVPQEARKDLALLHQFIEKNHITGGCYTTQLGQMLLQQYPDLPVDYLVVGGEKMTVAPECRCRLINTYGPTEFTVDATYYDVEPGKHYRNIPIGRALHNLSAYVVDTYGHLVPQGVPGELCMAGVQMAAGYWKREDLTQTAFSEISVAGKSVKVYHTGDLVRYNEAGAIEYLGRIDTQVKLRGFRIELGEIETLIGKYPGILMESVQVREVAGVQHLCAYYTASTAIDADALRSFLAESLTDYMVPTGYMQLDEMPLTPNGKVDRRKLPDPENTFELENVAPRNNSERKLLELSTTILQQSAGGGKVPDFGVTDDLVLLGMNSILAMRLAAQADKEGIALKVNDILKHRTIEKILSNNMRMGYWVKEYQKGKPVLVLLHGIISTDEMTEKFRQWQHDFNIFAIEPTSEHEPYIFLDANFKEVVEMYTSMLDLYIPMDAHVHAFVGYSWGGEQAYCVAKRWQEVRGETVNVYLGDSHMNTIGIKKEIKPSEVSQGLVDEVRHKYAAFANATDAQIRDEVSKVLSRNCQMIDRLMKGFTYPEYSGKVRLFNAKKDNPEEHSNVEAWRQLAPNIEVIDVDDTHSNLYSDDRYIGLFTQWLEKDLHND